MLSFLLEYLIGAVLVLYLISSNFSGVLALLDKLALFIRKIGSVNVNRACVRTVSIRLFQIIIGMIAGNLFIDPLIPGHAEIHVSTHEPPAISETLRVRMAPIKYNGEVDWSRSYFCRFDASGKLEKSIQFSMFENKLFIHLFNATQPETPLMKKRIHISVYARMGIWPRKFRL